MINLVETKRKKGESFESFLRRFSRRLLRSGKLYEAKKRKYLPERKSDLLKKRSALISKKYREKREYLEKIGKLKNKI